MRKASGNFGRVLRELRKSENLTQERFSKVLETDRSNIANYEAGKRLPPLDSLIKIARFFNVSLDYLVFGSNESLVLQDTTDRFNRELMAENTILMEAQVKLQQDVMKKDETIKMQKEMITVLKKYSNMLESKLKK